MKGLGAALAQQQEDGKVCICVTITECNYAITELETLGFVWAAKLFCPKQFGTVLGHVNRPCCPYISPQFKEPFTKLAHWEMVIQELNLDICHRSGKNNYVAI